MKTREQEIEAAAHAAVCAGGHDHAPYHHALNYYIAGANAHALDHPVVIEMAELLERIVGETTNTQVIEIKAELALEKYRAARSSGEGG